MLAATGSSAFAQSTNAAAPDVLRLYQVTDVGELPPTTSLPLLLVMKYQHESELRALVESQSTPGSPMFHHYLTKDQFVASYAPTAAAYAQAVAKLQGAGFRVTTSDPDRNMIGVQAPVSVINRYFSTSIHRVLTNGRSAFANVKSVTIPAELPDVLSVNGLDNVALLRAQVIPADLSKAPKSHMLRPYSLSPNAIGGPPNGPSGQGYGPSAIASAYNIPANYGYTGAGRRIGIVGGGNFLDSDLQSYLSYFQVNRTGPTYREPTNGGGVFNPNDSNQSLEAILDVTTIAGLAPGAIIDFKNAPAPLSSPNFLQEINELLGITGPQVDVISISFGACEGNKMFDDGIDSYALRASSQGTSIVASSGDQGYYGCGGFSQQNKVNSPASNPNVLAIGGTSPNTETVNTLGYAAQYAWTGSGGGSSARFARPYWQQYNVPGSKRGVPDVSFAADGNYYAFLYFNNQPSGGYGTSWATPIWASIQAEINQEQGRYHGSAGASLYNAFRTYGYSSGTPPMFNDITAGNTGGYYAAPGWDFTTGVGSANGQRLSSVE